VGHASGALRYSGSGLGQQAQIRSWQKLPPAESDPSVLPRSTGRHCPVTHLPDSDAGVVQESGSSTREEKAEPKYEPHRGKTNQHHLLPNYEELKNRLAITLRVPVYDVTTFYHRTGFMQGLARSSVFNNMTLCVIVLNTLWIAYDTDNNRGVLSPSEALFFERVNNFFCTYFFFELSVRLLSFRRKCDALKDSWFIFDALLVLMMVWETWIQYILAWLMGAPPNGHHDGGHMTSASILRVLRVLRLLRVARMARLVRNMPEVMILVKGMAMAMRSVMVVLCLLVLVIYIFAIVFTQLLAGTIWSEGCFDTVPQAMNFLLMQVVCGFDESAIKRMLAAGMLYYCLFLLYLLFGSLTLMNMLIGILCEIVAEVAEVEKEEIFTKEVEYEVHRVTKALDTDGTNTISKEEFDALIDSPGLMQSLQSLGVDIVALIDFVHFIYLENDELTFSNFLDTVIQFRGSKAATVKDVVDMRKFVSMELSSLEARLKTRYAEVHDQK